MSLVKYEILDKVARLNSFTKAAEILGLTQSAISHAISSLEKDYGFALVHRNKHGVTLTDEGVIMLTAIRNVLHAEEMLKQEAAKIIGVTKGKVRIGTFSSISTKMMPKIIQLMDRQYPGIEIELREGDYFEIEQWLKEGEIDCGFLNKTHTKQTQFTPLLQDELFCIVSSKSTLFNKESVDLNEIETEPFILTTYNGPNDVLAIFERYRINPTIRFKLFDEKGVISMVEHNLGITILPQLVIDQLPKNVRKLKIKQESFRTIGLATKLQMSPAAEKFVEVLMHWLSTNEIVHKV
ncbi:LysR family transcriptional regulator [Lysinibacillus sp. BW-2-10]|uniref:LysR family transcriptional regulator n=1 Tax=Lysinibacillus sp. BW-2-10 TaxID=2590030 RepID=UPI00117DDAE4|nr:LysR family transcriptional regulator [Lysinibacillus sp. BW-2-10]TSI09105.1 LysR family transcriptional regulator [Lysinibacillus sp. BW-2-10]